MTGSISGGKNHVIIQEINMLKSIRRVFNVLFCTVIFWKWTQMIRGANGSFASHGLKSLKWFTVLSNLLEAAACITWLFLTASEETVLFFLGPLFGYEGMFKGPNLWFHLLVPVIAGLEFMFLNKEEMRKKEKRLATVPMFLYGAVYIGNNMINGIGKRPYTNDWYGFLSWGWAAGVGIFACIIAVTRILASLLAGGNRFFHLIGNKR